MSDVIEQIARRWFDTMNRTSDVSWDDQPDVLKNVFRSKAISFWQCPDAPYAKIAHHESLTRYLAYGVFGKPEANHMTNGGN